VKNSENTQAAPVVTHITEVKISLEPEENIIFDAASGRVAVTPIMVRQAGTQLAEHYERVAAMMEFLAGHGFTFSSRAKSVHCFSREVEAGEVKQLLIKEGFKDREFQIVLEYTRGWGML
jgi:hypothetical protein